jgi:hypothetical protein
VSRERHHSHAAQHGAELCKPEIALLFVDPEAYGFGESYEANQLSPGIEERDVNVALFVFLEPGDL